MCSPIGSGFGLGLAGISPNGEMAKVIAEMDEYIRKCQPFYPSWYVGVAADARQRLFSDHNVDEKNGCWIFRPCSSDTISRNVEQHFLNKGCKGGAGGGDRSTVYVYAYLVTRDTRE